jgi:hypothetical protein
MKKRRLELLASVIENTDKTYVNQSDFEPIPHDHTFCVGVAMEGRPLDAPATIMAFWRKEKSEETCSEELTQLKLTAKSICNGELCIDEKCLNLWNGKGLNDGSDYPLAAVRGGGGFAPCTAAVGPVVAMRAVIIQWG